MQVVKTHLITSAAIVIEESISQTYGIQTLTTAPVWVLFPWHLCFSFMLLNNAEGSASICLSQGDGEEYVVLNLLKKRLFPLPTLSF